VRNPTDITAGGPENESMAANSAPGSSRTFYDQQETRMDTKYKVDSRYYASWWDKNHDSAWNKVKDAFQRDWDQTKHDFGGDEPDLNQDVPDTIKQAAGKQHIPPPDVPNFEAAEPAYRFGYGARLKYGTRYPKWNDDVESILINDWPKDNSWPRYKRAIRRGYEYPLSE
jgi:hypothetical protein